MSEAEKPKLALLGVGEWQAFDHIVEVHDIGRYTPVIRPLKGQPMSELDKLLQVLEHSARLDERDGLTIRSEMCAEAAAVIRRLAAENAKAKAEAEREVRRAEVAETRMRAWEQQVYLVNPHPTLRVMQRTEFGDDPAPIPLVAEKISVLLDRMAHLTAENEAAMNTIKGLISSSERLEARIKELEGALRPFAEAERSHGRHIASGRSGLAPSNWTNYDDFRSASAALGESHD